MPQPETALLVGATGLVGRALLEQLLASPTCRQINVLTRRPLAHGEAKMEMRVQPFGQIAELAAAEPEFFAVDVAYCCLGTTLKTAGSKQAFAQVDRDYVQAIAQAAAAGGTRCFTLVSAVGADPRSRVFYSRIKGEAEAAVIAAGFESVCIVRPSLLLGERGETRRGEAAAQRLAPLFTPLLRGPLQRYQPVHAQTVARHMLAVSAQARAGVTVSYPTASSTGSAG